MYPSQAAFAEHCGVTFIMGADFPRHEAAAAFGVYDEQRGVNQRVTFLIDKEGIIRHVIEDREDMERHSQEALDVIKSWA